MRLFGRSRSVARGNVARESARSVSECRKSDIMSGNVVQERVYWQTKQKDVVEAVASMYGNEAGADVLFSVEKEEFIAHSFVMIMRSPVLMVHFLGDFKKSVVIRNGKTYKQIEVLGVKAKPFGAFLKFLYTNSLEVSPEIVMGVLNTAKKYIVPVLEDYCYEYLETNLSADNIVAIWIEAKKDERVIGIIMKWIDNNTKDFFASNSFKVLDLELLCGILSRDTLTIQETMLFQAVIRWAKAQCELCSLAPSGKNLRQVLGNALFFVRFPLMGLIEFSKIQHWDVLSKKEIFAMIKYFGNPDSKPVFPTSPRNYQA